MYCKNTIKNVIKENQGKAFSDTTVGEIDKITSDFTKKVYKAARKGRGVSKEGYAKKVWKKIGKALFGTLRQYSQERLAIIDMVTKRVTDGIFTSVKGRLRREALKENKSGVCPNIGRYPRMTLSNKGIPTLKTFVGDKEKDILDIYKKDIEAANTAHANRAKKWAQILGTIDIEASPEPKNPLGAQLKKSSSKGPKRNKKSTKSYRKKTNKNR